MRISHKHKFIFLSKPRCASESIRAMLDNYSDIFSSRQDPFRHHVSALELKTHFHQVGWDWEKYFKFISIRNPWDMMVSVYFYSKPDINGTYFWNNSSEKKYIPDQLMAFDEWINRSGFYFWTLKRFILDEDGNQLVDLIVKVEDLETGLKDFFDRVNIPRSQIPHINKTKHKKYKDYYNEETKRKVEKVFEYDIQIGKYTF